MTDFNNPDNGSPYVDVKGEVVEPFKEHGQTEDTMGVFLLTETLDGHHPDPLKVVHPLKVVDPIVATFEDDEVSEEVTIERDFMEDSKFEMRHVAISLDGQIHYINLNQDQSLIERNDVLRRFFLR